MDILKLSIELIKVKTPPDNYSGLEKALKIIEQSLKGYTIEHFVDHGYKSILVYKGKKRPSCFKVLLNGHLDIIPGKENQYDPIIEGNKLYGAGSMDMKSNVACLVSTFIDVVGKVSYPLGLQIVTDEELGGFYGTKYQIEKGVTAEFVISGETTNFDIVNMAKGILWLKIHSKGKTAHGAYPWKGDNAIWQMHDFLKQIRAIFPPLVKESWISTLNLSSINSSNATYNKIPDDCSIMLDIRFIPKDQDRMLKTISSMIPKTFELEVVVNEPALSVDKNNSFLKSLKKITEVELKKDIQFRSAQGSSDARHFSRYGIPAIEFGPVGGGIGTDEEWVDIESLSEYKKTLESFILSL